MGRDPNILVVGTIVARMGELSDALSRLLCFATAYSLTGQAHDPWNLSSGGYDSTDANMQLYLVLGSTARMGTTVLPLTLTKPRSCAAEWPPILCSRG